MIPARVFIACSLDGFIAREDGSLDWLSEGVPSGEDYGYAAFVETIDGLIMGRKTFDVVSSFDEWPYTKPVVVMSHTLCDADLPLRLKDQVTLSREAPRDLLARLEGQGWSAAYIDGGVTIREFLAQGLVDTMVVSRLPVLLGQGTPLFHDMGQEFRFELIASQSLPAGLVQSTYRPL